MKKVLITGGTGLVGSRLTSMLLAKGYKVAYLSRRKQDIPSVEVYTWDPEKGYISDEALESVDFLVHLAGANVNGKRWNAAYKKEIYDSRVLSTKLLAEKFNSSKYPLQAAIVASAIGIYGETGAKWVQEDAPAANTFLAKVCVDWEAQAHRFNTRTCIFRIGVVLSEKEGALVEMAKPIRAYAGAALGTGNQYMSWIHIDDLCRMLIFGIENTLLEGTFNATAPQPVTNLALTQIIAKVLNRPLLLPNVPPFALRLLVGEMADVVLTSCRCATFRLQAAGFSHNFHDCKQSVSHLLLK
jgi:uncharacterized protein (TIGR01777 family)